MHSALRPSPQPHERRRLYLMRHGAVSYFDQDGRRRLPEHVALNRMGQAQADSAGACFAAAGVRFDRIICSGLPRTRETAERVLASMDHAGAVEELPALQEIRGGRLSMIAEADLPAAFTGLSRAMVSENTRFLGGESLAELLDRILPPFRTLLMEPGWQVALLVLHGAVNTALLSYLLSGGDRCFFGTLVQSPGCINVIDAGHDPAASVVRLINHSPGNPLQPERRETPLEGLLSDYQAHRAALDDLHSS